MRIGVEFPKEKILQLINLLDFEGEKLLDEILVKLLSLGINSSDLLFVALQKLEEMDIVKGSGGKIKISRILSKEEKEDLFEHLDNFIKKNSLKLFLTPLEVAKFFQCPRRLFLEKIVLSKQHKESKGRAWDGEIVHKSVYLLLKNILREDLTEIIPLLVKKVLKEYQGKYTLNEKEVEEFLFTFYEFVRKENFRYIFPETTIISFKIGLMGTPDIIAINSKWEIIPIDLKLGELKNEVKKEHILQNVGEGLLAESFFRKKVERCVLVYYTSKNIAEVKLEKKLKSKFMDLKKRIIRMIKYGRIPPKSNLQNYQKRVCPGCHVKHACKHIEELRKALK